MIVIVPNESQEAETAPSMGPLARDLSDDPSSLKWISYSLPVWILLLVASLFGGPRLGDHEVIVAQAARQMVFDRDWIVPHYLDTPFLLKPPLSYWCVALASTLFPLDAATGLPVPPAAARLPSFLASLFSLWLVWRLGRSMFGVVAARMAAVAYATCIGILLFAVNATSEALLTAFCTWAYAEAWWATQSGTGLNCLRHQFRFFIALALAMLAKGPMPLVVVVAPIALWMVLEPPLCEAGSGNWPCVRNAFRRIPKNLWSHCRALGLGWGWILFLALIVPWIVAVYRREPYVLELWRYEYFDRLQGNYPGTGKNGIGYYLPILLGLTIPWSLSIPQALASPFQKLHFENRRPLIFVWCWVVVGLVLCSCMSFKKPYYILPIIPGCALLLGPTLDHFFQRTRDISRRSVDSLKRVIPGLALAILIIIWIIGNGLLREELRPQRLNLIILTAGVLLGISTASLWFITGRRFASFLAIAATSLGVFTASWLLLDRALDNAEPPHRLAVALDLAGVPRNARVVWCDGRPDGRLTYYYGRIISQIIDPYHAIIENRRSGGASDLVLMTAEKVSQSLRREPNSYFVFSREKLELFISFFHPAIRRVVVVPRGPGLNDSADWVVITSEMNPAE